MEYRIFALSENSATIDFGNIISESLNATVMGLAEALSADGFPGLIELVPAYSSLTAFYDVLKVKKSFPEFATAFEAVSAFIERTLAKTPKTEKSDNNLVAIPVCYDEEFALDLSNISEASNLAANEIIKIHTETIYRVFMLGFLPGFAYMGEADKRIAVPRLETPRTKVPKGSVGIAGNQTGIYPLESPGGWQIVGRTPLELFRPDKSEITLLKSGDMVKFYQIDKKEFLKIAK